jgi:tetratricopeptide (TPR) repeat protein
MRLSKRSTSTKFLTQYPNSDLAPKMLLSLAGYFDEKFDYANAAKFYELYAQKDPKNACSRCFVQRSSVPRKLEDLCIQQLKNYDRYLELYPSNKDAPVVFFSRGVIYEKLNSPIAASKVFEDYFKRYGRKNATAIEAIYRLAKTQKRLGKPDDCDCETSDMRYALPRNWEQVLQLAITTLPKQMFELAEAEIQRISIDQACDA